jgi:hypothetical protein
MNIKVILPYRIETYYNTAFVNIDSYCHYYNNEYTDHYTLSEDDAVWYFEHDMSGDNRICSKCAISFAKLGITIVNKHDIDQYHTPKDRLDRHRDECPKIVKEMKTKLDLLKLYKNTDNIELIKLINYQTYKISNKNINNNLLSDLLNINNLTLFDLVSLYNDYYDTKFYVKDIRKLLAIS